MGTTSLQHAFLSAKKERSLVRFLIIFVLLNRGSPWYQAGQPVRCQHA